MNPERPGRKLPPEEREKLFAILKQIDPTWSGELPEFRKPIELPPRKDGRSWDEALPEVIERIMNPGPDPSED